MFRWFLTLAQLHKGMKEEKHAIYAERAQAYARDIYKLMEDGYTVTIGKASYSQGTALPTLETALLYQLHKTKGEITYTAKRKEGGVSSSRTFNQRINFRM